APSRGGSGPRKTIASKGPTTSRSAPPCPAMRRQIPCSPESHRSRGAMNVPIGRCLPVCSLLAVVALGCGGQVHRSEYLAPAEARVAVHSAAVLPLENLTARPDAGKAVADQLAIELAARKLVVVDRGRAEAALAKVDVVPGGTIDRLAAQRLGQILGVDAV